MESHSMLYWYNINEWSFDYFIIGLQQTDFNQIICVL